MIRRFIPVLYFVASVFFLATFLSAVSFGGVGLFVLIDLIFKN